MEVSMCARLQVHLPSKEKKLRFEAQLKLDGVRLQSIINIFGEARKQPGVVPLDWKGAWRISGAGEIPMDHPENFRWNGDMALDGDLIYASGANKHRIAEANFFNARGGAGGDHLRSQGGPLGWKSRCREVAGPSALEGEETANRNAAHPRRRAVAIDHQQF